MPDTDIVATGPEVASHAAEQARRVLSAAIESHGSATWVLAGGSSPMQAYRAIVAAPESAAIDWSKVRLVIGDERLVPLAHPDSNWGQIMEVLQNGPTSAAQGLVPATDMAPFDAAADYEAQLSALARIDGARRLDLVWLGMGEDGHTLSLFPDHPLLKETGERRVASIVDSPKPPPERITLTLTSLDDAQNVVIFAVGAGKRDALSAAQEGEALPVAMAAERARQTGAEVTWLIDLAAAGEPAPE